MLMGVDYDGARVREYKGGDCMLTGMMGGGGVWQRK